MSERRRNGNNSRSRKKEPNVIFVKLGRLGDEVREFTFPAGVTVEEVLEKAGIDGAITTVKLNGTKVDLDRKINASCTLVSLAKVKAG